MHIKSTPLTSLPAVSIAQMRRVDELMEESYEILPIQMMEHAGYNLAQLVQSMLPMFGTSVPVVWVFAGTGGNGVGALIAARRLAIYGYRVAVFVPQPVDAFRPEGIAQIHSVEQLDVPVYVDVTHGQCDLCIDGLLGFGAVGTPTGRYASHIQWMNAQSAPVVSLDGPSGLDFDTGAGSDLTVRATATMTVGLPKRGFLGESAREYLGDLYLADIGIPPKLYKDAFDIDMDPRVFSETSLLAFSVSCGTFG